MGAMEYKCSLMVHSVGCHIFDFNEVQTCNSIQSFTIVMEVLSTSFLRALEILISIINDNVHKISS